VTLYLQNYQKLLHKIGYYSRSLLNTGRALVLAAAWAPFWRTLWEHVNTAQRVTFRINGHDRR